MIDWDFCLQNPSLVNHPISLKPIGAGHIDLLSLGCDETKGPLLGSRYFGSDGLTIRSFMDRTGIPGLHDGCHVLDGSTRQVARSRIRILTGRGDVVRFTQALCSEPNT